MGQDGVRLRREKANGLRCVALTLFGGGGRGGGGLHQLGSGRQSLALALAYSLVDWNIKEALDLRGMQVHRLWAAWAERRR